MPSTVSIRSHPPRADLGAARRDRALHRTAEAPRWRRLAAVLSICGVLAGAVPVRADVESVALASTLSVVSLNWPDALWTFRAIQRDASDLPVGALAPQIDFVLSSEWPSIQVVISATAPADHDILFLRSNQKIRIGDTVEGYVYACDTSTVCDAGSPSNIALANTLPWVDVTVPGLFEGDFEGGDLTRWSDSVGGP